MNWKFKNIAIFLVLTLIFSLSQEMFSIKATTQNTVSLPDKYQILEEGFGKTYHTYSGNQLLYSTLANRWKIKKEGESVILRAYSLDMEDANKNALYQPQLLENTKEFFQEEAHKDSIIQLIKYSEEKLKQLEKIEEKQAWAGATQLVIWSMLYGEGALGLENFSYEENWKYDYGDVNRLFFHKSVSEADKNTLLQRFGKNQKIQLIGKYNPYWLLYPKVLHQTAPTLEQFIKDGADLSNQDDLDFELLINGKVRLPRIPVRTEKCYYYIKLTLNYPQYYTELRQKLQEFEKTSKPKKLTKELIFKVESKQLEENGDIEITGSIHTDNFRHIIPVSEAEQLTLSLALEKEELEAEKYYTVSVQYQNYNEWKFTIKISNEAKDLIFHQGNLLKLKAAITTFADNETSIIALVNSENPAATSLILTSEAAIPDILCGQKTIESIWPSKEAPDLSEKDKETPEKDPNDNTEEEAIIKIGQALYADGSVKETVALAGVQFRLNKINPSAAASEKIFSENTNQTTFYKESENLTKNNENQKEAAGIYPMVAGKPAITLTSLENDIPEPWTEEYTTDENGKLPLNFSELPNGDYALTEIFIPEQLCQKMETEETLTAVLEKETEIHKLYSRTIDPGYQLPEEDAAVSFFTVQNGKLTSGKLIIINTKQEQIEERVEILEKEEPAPKESEPSSEYETPEEMPEPITPENYTNTENSSTAILEPWQPEETNQAETSQIADTKIENPSEKTTQEATDTMDEKTAEEIISESESEISEKITDSLIPHSSSELPRTSGLPAVFWLLLGVSAAIGGIFLKGK